MLSCCERYVRAIEATCYFPFQTNKAVAAAVVSVFACLEPLTRSSHTPPPIAIDSRTREHYLLFLLFGWMRWDLDTDKRERELKKRRHSHSFTTPE